MLRHTSPSGSCINYSSSNASQWNANQFHWRACCARCRSALSLSVDCLADCHKQLVDGAFAWYEAKISSLRFVWRSMRRKQTVGETLLLCCRWCVMTNLSVPVIQSMQENVLRKEDSNKLWEVCFSRGELSRLCHFNGEKTWKVLNKSAFFKEKLCWIRFSWMPSMISLETFGLSWRAFMFKQAFVNSK